MCSSPGACALLQLWCEAPADTCTCKDGTSYDMFIGGFWQAFGVDGMVEVYERLGRTDDVVESARVTRSRFPFNPFLRYAGHMAVARCHAAAGRNADASVLFRQAADEARHRRLFWLEALACRDALHAAATTQPDGGANDLDDALLRSKSEWGSMMATAVASMAVASSNPDAELTTILGKLVGGSTR